MGFSVNGNWQSGQSSVVGCADNDDCGAEGAPQGCDQQNKMHETMWSRALNEKQMLSNEANSTAAHNRIRAGGLGEQKRLGTSVVAGGTVAEGGTSEQMW